MLRLRRRRLRYEVFLAALLLAFAASHARAEDQAPVVEPDPSPLTWTLGFESGSARWSGADDRSVTVARASFLTTAVLRPIDHLFISATVGVSRPGVATERWTYNVPNGPQYLAQDANGGQIELATSLLLAGAVGFPIALGASDFELVPAVDVSVDLPVAAGGSSLSALVVDGGGLVTLAYEPIEFVRLLLGVRGGYRILSLRREEADAQSLGPGRIPVGLRVGIELFASGHEGFYVLLNGAFVDQTVFAVRAGWAF